MSNCKLTLKVGGESIEVSVDSSSLPENYIALKKLLLSLKKWDSLIDNIRGSLKNRKPIKDIELEELIKSNHLISNATVANLKARYPSVEFPKDTENYKISRKKVLFVNKYKTKRGNLLYGRVINQNGEEIFVVDSQHVGKLAKFFLLLLSIVSSNIITQLDDTYKKLLDLIYKEALKDSYLRQQINTFIKGNNKEISKEDLQRESLLFIFSLTKSPFRSIVYNFEEKTLGAYRLLEEISSNILDTPTSNKSYQDPIINILSDSISEYSKDFREAKIQKAVIFKVLPKDITDKLLSSDITKKDGTLSYDKLNKEFNKSVKDNLDLFTQIFGVLTVSKYPIEYTGWGILLQELLNKDKSFNFEYKSVDGNNITLKKFSSNLSSVYGVGFELLLEWKEPTYYNGEYILENTEKDGNTVYYVTNFYTTEFLYAKKFNTLEEAQDYINLDKNIIDNSYKQLHSLELNNNGELITDDSNNLQMEVSNYIPEQSLLTVIDYDVPSLDLEEVPEEMRGFISSNIETKKMSDFKDFVEEKLIKYLKNGFYTSLDKEKILSTINTPEKVFLFISELNNPNYNKSGRKIDLSEKEEVLNLVDSLKEKFNNFRYYYVKNYYSKNKTVTLIPFKPELVKEYRKDRKYPIQNVWEAAQKVLSPKLGTNISLNVLTQSLIEEELGEEYSEFFNAKAFIKNNNIYINKDLASPEDFFHEYVHIVLGMLKTNDSTKEQYKKLLEEVWEYEKDESLKASILDTYKDYSFLDLMEEYFAVKFGNWIKNHTKKDYSNIFENSILKKGTYLLFNSDNKNKSLKDFYGKKLPDVFLNFNSEIGLYLKEHPTLAEGEFSNLFSLSRKKSEWIRLLIHDKKLFERDCV